MTVKIPATVITGFLGAGKTSLIRHLLEHSSGRRLALLINEFGNLGIDRGIIHPSGAPRPAMTSDRQGMPHPPPAGR